MKVINTEAGSIVWRFKNSSFEQSVYGKMREIHYEDGSVHLQIHRKNFTTSPVFCGDKSELLYVRINYN